MAEVVGLIASAYGLTAIFKACYDAFELFRAAKAQEYEFKKLVLLLSFEQRKLRHWGQTLGLDPEELGEEQKISIDEEDARLVRETLQVLQGVLQNAEQLKSRYGFVPKTVEELDLDETTELVLRTSDRACEGILSSKPRRMNKQILKVRWVANDGKKLKAFVSDVRDYVNCLRDIRPIEALQPMVLALNDPQALDMVADAAKDGYLEIASLATDRSEVMSRVTGQAPDDKILAWQAATELDQFDIARIMEELWSSSYWDLQNRILVVQQESQDLKHALRESKSTEQSNELQRQLRLNSELVGHARGILIARMIKPVTPHNSALRTWVWVAVVGYGYYASIEMLGVVMIPVVSLAVFAWLYCSIEINTVHGQQGLGNEIWMLVSQSPEHPELVDVQECTKVALYGLQFLIQGATKINALNTTIWSCLVATIVCFWTGMRVEYCVASPGRTNPFCGFSFTGSRFWDITLCSSTCYVIFIVIVIIYCETGDRKRQTMREHSQRQGATDTKTSCLN